MGTYSFHARDHAEAYEHLRQFTDGCLDHGGRLFETLMRIDDERRVVSQFGSVCHLCQEEWELEYTTDPTSPERPEGPDSD